MRLDHLGYRRDIEAQAAQLAALGTRLETTPRVTFDAPTEPV